MDFAIPEKQSSDVQNETPETAIPEKKDSSFPQIFQIHTRPPKQIIPTEDYVKPQRSTIRAIFNFFLILIITLLVAILIIFLGVLLFPNVKDSVFYFAIDKIANSFQVENIPLLDENRDLTNLNFEIKRINNSPSLVETLVLDEKDLNTFIKDKIRLSNGEIVDTRVALDTNIIHVFVKYKDHNSPWVQLDFSTNLEILAFLQTNLGTNVYTLTDTEKLLKFLPLGIETIDTKALMVSSAKLILGANTKYAVTKVNSTYQKLSLTFEKSNK